MPLPIADKERALAQLSGSTQRFVSLLRTADGSRNAIGHWNSAEVATHVGHIFKMYAEFARGGESPVSDHRNISPIWDRMVAEDTERDMVALAERIERGHAELVEALGRIGWTDKVHWHGGLQVPAYALVGILVNETEIHGLDIATAEDAPWKISRPNAALALESLYTVMPEYLDPAHADKLNAIWLIKLRGASSTYFQLSGSRMNITTDKPGTVDCVISADPMTYLLVGYGRTGQWGAVLKGKVMTYGRKPWLGLTFAKLFQSV